jgi:VanZ family protein
MAAKRAPYLHRKWYAAGAVLLGAVMAIVIEIGQVALPGKYPNSTDIVLEVIGVVIGYILADFLVNKLGASRVQPFRQARPNA